MAWAAAECTRRAATSLDVIKTTRQGTSVLCLVCVVSTGGDGCKGWLKTLSFLSIVVLLYKIMIDRRNSMEAVLISPKFQVVIPKSVRNLLKLLPGQKVQILAYDNRVEIIPELSISEMRGFLKGIDTGVERENDRV